AFRYPPGPRPRGSFADQLCACIDTGSLMLIAYAQVGPPGTLQVWVGVLGTANPPAPTLAEASGQGQQHVVSPLRPIRDAIADPADKPLNHRAILRLNGLQPGTSYRVTVSAGAESRELSIGTLPDALPQKMDGNFNILLC